MTDQPDTLRQRIADRLFALMREAADYTANDPTFDHAKVRSEMTTLLDAVMAEVQPVVAERDRLAAEVGRLGTMAADATERAAWCHQGEADLAAAVQRVRDFCDRDQDGLCCSHVTGVVRRLLDGPAEPAEPACPGHTECARCDVTDPCPCCGLRYVAGEWRPATTGPDDDTQQHEATQDGGRPTHPDGTPYRYAEIVASGWEHCDGCRSWGQWTQENPHNCPMTYIHGPAAK